MSWENILKFLTCWPISRHDKYLYLVQQMVPGPTLYKELQERGPFTENRHSDPAAGSICRYCSSSTSGG